MNHLKFTDKLLTFPQYLLPQHFLSRLMLKFTRLQMGKLTHWMIKQFIKFYHVDMSIAQSSNIKSYHSFNDFFTRAIQPTARPFGKEEIISPVDAIVSQIGQVNKGNLLQAKNHSFSVEALLGNDIQMATLFKQGLFCTLYLAPKDYHRIHIPIDAELVKMIYIPGRLFSVNQRTTSVVSNLFARNERVVCLFNTKWGSMALILVGALFVGSIDTVWAGTVAPNTSAQIQHWNYKTGEVILTNGDEMGRFNMGSTVIMLLNGKQLKWLPELTIGKKILMGQNLAKKLV
ncbi:MAG: phosphatidylserine decarboxylase [Thiomargarita sp.]|nr:phosphatidylserine decarboxylase [Thiomargarita sp.]